jgi:uncharacterized protein YdaU (DUF1376 family)
VNYYEHHLGDWAAATSHLSWDEDMAYTRLLRAYYHAEGPIADGQQYRLARAASSVQRRAVDAVLAEFFYLADGHYRQKRADEEIKRYRESEPDREAKRENAKERQRRSRDRRKAMFDALRGHDIVPAWDTPTKQLESLLSQVTVTPVTPPVTCDDTATHTHTHTQHHTQLKKEIPPKPPKGAVHGFPPGFEEFWRAYPRKVGKDAAAKAFARRKVDAALLAQILGALERQRPHLDLRDDGRFIPHPSTWLNEGRWLDEPDLLQQGGNGVAL